MTPSTGKAKQEYSPWEYCQEAFFVIALEGGRSKSANKNPAGTGGVFIETIAKAIRSPS
jgi:hypothetical protein